MKKTILLVSLFLFQFSASAASTDEDVTIPTIMTPVVGQWIGDYHIAKNFAESTGTPLILIWSNHGCEFCNRLKTALLESRFKNWQSGDGRFFVYCIVEGTGTDHGQSDAKDFAKCSGGFPYIAMWWKSKSGEIKKTFTGRLPGFESGNESKKSASYENLNDLADLMISNAELVFADYHPDCSLFLPSDTDGDRLEFTDETKTVFAPYTDQDGERRCLEVDVEGKTSDVVITLTNEGGEVVDTTTIHYVANGPTNSPKNPLWFGERTAETLKPGEWTMDRDLALGKAAKNSAVTMTLVGGSLWCPDCVNTDEYLINTDVFKNWATGNNVYCVAIDEPIFASGSLTPTLVSYDNFDVSWLNGITSGAGYLSRKSADPEVAAATLERNLNLATNSVFAGGLCRPEQLAESNTETGKWKLGIPCILLESASGRIMGRLYQFSTVSPTNDTSAAAYVQRFEELRQLALVDDPTEEVNKHWCTATNDACRLSIANKSITSTISAIDNSDCWRLVGRDKWLRTSFTVELSDGALASRPELKSQNVTLNLYKVKLGESDYATKPVKTVSGAIGDGVTLEGCEIEPENGYEYFIQLQTIETSAAFSLTHEGDSTVAYTLAAKSVEDPGTISLTETAKTVSEVDAKKAGGALTVYIPFKRTGGATGEAKVTLTVDAATTAFADRYQLITEEIVWADGELGAKSAAIKVFDDDNADGTQFVVVKAMGLSSASPATWTLTINDNDKSQVGTVAFESSEPAIAKGRNVYALEGSTARIGVARLSGASGDVAAEVKLDGAVATNFTWRSRESGLQWLDVKLPLIAENGSEKVNAAFGALSGIKANSSKKNLVINLISTSAPYFAESEIVFDSLARYCALNREVAIEQIPDGAKLALTKLSGSLPSGVKVSLSGGVMMISGTPTAVKSCEAVYQISATVNRQKILGRTCRLVFNVIDVSKLDSADPGANPYVAKSHTFGDMPVVDEDEKRLTGLITGLTIPATGKASAKYKCAAGTIALSATGWSEYNAANGTLSATLVKKNSAYALAVKVTRDGEVTVALSDPDFEGETLTASVPEAWDATTHSAAPWAGYYVAAIDQLNENASPNVFCTGSPYITMKMNTSSMIKKGTMSYAGVLPNGQAVSGSGTLVADDLGLTTTLPVYYRSTKDFFTALPEIKTGGVIKAVEAAESVALPYWRHTESATTDGCFTAVYSKIYGSYYDTKLDLTTTIDSTAVGHELVFGKTGPDPVAVNIGASKLTLDADEAKMASVKLSFTKSTGVISGSFKTTDSSGKSVTATYKGVLLPDWGDECRNCGGAGWALGSYWYSEKIQYSSGNRTRSLSVKGGGEVAIEKITVTE